MKGILADIHVSPDSFIRAFASRSHAQRVGTRGNVGPVSNRPLSGRLQTGPTYFPSDLKERPCLCVPRPFAF